MTPLLIDHIAFVLLAVVFPIWEFFALRKRAALIRAGRTELRMGLYRRIIGEEWLMAIALLAGWFALGRGGAALGLVPRGGALAWMGYGLSALVSVVLLLLVLASPSGVMEVEAQQTEALIAYEMVDQWPQRGEAAEGLLPRPEVDGA